jgi:hypothetical protein
VTGVATNGALFRAAEPTRVDGKVTSSAAFSFVATEADVRRAFDAGHDARRG